MKGKYLKITRKQLGDLVREKRIEMGLSQSQLGARAQWDNVGVSRLESGVGPRGPVLKVVRLCRILGINLSESQLVRNGICSLRQGIEHGTNSSYARGCRCPRCSVAHYKATSAMRNARRHEPKDFDPEDPRHGTNSYLYECGCRCVPCQKLHRSKHTRHGKIYYQPLQQQEEK